MPTAANIPIKQGATFAVAGTVKLPAGNWSATCQARTASMDSLVQEFVVDVQPLGVPTADATHSVSITASSFDTETWPVGQLSADVRYADASTPPVVIPSDTFYITVTKWETHA